MLEEERMAVIESSAGDDDLENMHVELLSDIKRDIDPAPKSLNDDFDDGTSLQYGPP